MRADLFELIASSFITPTQEIFDGSPKRRLPFSASVSKASVGNRFAVAMQTASTACFACSHAMRVLRIVYALHVAELRKQIPSRAA